MLLLGNEEPRVYTPPLRELTPETSLGFSLIEFAEDYLELDLLPWQKWLAIHALEVRPDGQLRFRNVVVLVARQNGKSLFTQVLSLWWLYVAGVELVLGTAQDLDTAEEVWAGAVNFAVETDDDGVPRRPELYDEVARVVQVNGKKSLDLKSGCRYKVKAASRRAGRGLSGNRILLDELREHQSWDAWGAITKTTMAQKDAQVWCVSNAGDATSVVLHFLRKVGHALVGDPDGINEKDGVLAADAQVTLEETDLGLFEWSAPPGIDKMDKTGWAQANPSVGYTITEEAITSAARTDPEPVFRTEVLCQWVTSTSPGPFAPGQWEQGLISSPEFAQQIVGPVKAAIDVSEDGATTWIVVAGRQASGRPQVEVAATQGGKAWVVDWLRQRVADGTIDEITGQGRGALVSPLLERLELEGLPVTPCQGPDLPAATTVLFDQVRDKDGAAHLAWAELDTAARTAVTKVLDGGAVVLDRRRSPSDIAPLQAMAEALWLLTRPTEAPAKSAYEDRRVLTI